MNNHMKNCLTYSLSAAKEVGDAMVVFGSQNRGQEFLNRALHSLLIVAEECRQQHAEDVAESKQRNMGEIEGLNDD